MKRDLSALFDPSSVAVLGASAIPGKWGYWLARGAIKGADRRSVYLVNRKGGEILGRQAHTSLAELPEPPELVVITVPAAGVEEAVDASLAAGAKGIVLISAGLGEMGEEGALRERAIVERVRAAGAVLIGPNCLGVHDSGAALELCSEELGAGLDRADLAERQPRARDRDGRRGVRARVLPLRLAREPGRRAGSGADRVLR